MKTYKVYDIENCQYTITVEKTFDGTSYVLCRSSDSRWRNPDEIVLSAVDNGNGIEFNKKQNKHFDYHVFCELAILTSFIVKYDRQLMSEIKIVEETNFCKI